MNPNSSADLRTQSVTSLLNMVNVSPHVCAYLGDSYLLRRLLDFQNPEWGIASIPLWVILVKVLASPLCACTYTLLLEHMNTIDQILEAMRGNSMDREECRPLAVPLVALLQKCAAWPVFMDRLMTIHGGVFVDLIRLGLDNMDDEFLIATCNSLVRVFHSISEERYQRLIHHYDDLVGHIFKVLKYATSKAAKIASKRPNTMKQDKDDDDSSTSSLGDLSSDEDIRVTQEATCEELMHLALSILASLSNHEEVRALIAENTYLDIALLKMFFSLPYQRVLAQFFLFLNNCCHSDVLFQELSRQSIIVPLMAHVEKTTDPETITHIAHLCYQFCKKAGEQKASGGQGAGTNGISILMEDKSINALFSLIKKGSPEAQEVAVQSFYHLATDDKVKRDIIRKGVLDYLCQLALHGAPSVQPHAAWLVASLTVRGSSRDLMYQRNTLTALSNLLS